MVWYSKHEDGVELHLPVCLSAVDPFAYTNTESARSHMVTVPCKGEAAAIFWLLRNPENKNLRVVLVLLGIVLVLLLGNV